MISFDGSMGTGGEGQQFFLLSISKNILHLMIQIIYFDGSSGTGAWGREHGDGSLGTGAWGWEHGDGSVGTGAWGWHHGNGTMGTARSERQQFFYYLFQKNFTSYD